MENKFCGVGKVPKGKTRGSMIDCVKKSQIRYYGLKKIDPTLIAAKISTGPSIKDVRRDMIVIKARYNKLVSKLKVALSQERKEEIFKEIKQVQKEFEAAKSKYDKMVAGTETTKPTITLDPLKIKKNAIKKSKELKKEKERKQKEKEAKERRKQEERERKKNMKKPSKKTTKKKTNPRPKKRTAYEVSKANKK